MRAATSPNTLSLRPTSVTEAPSRPNDSAAARPMPLVAPVTITDFPLKVMAWSLLEQSADASRGLGPATVPGDTVSRGENSRTGPKPRSFNAKRPKQVGKAFASQATG